MTTPSVCKEEKFHHQVKLKGSISASTHVELANAGRRIRVMLVPALTVSTAWIEQKQLVRGRLTSN
jgi:hypothetical protein